MNCVLENPLYFNVFETYIFLILLCHYQLAVNGEMAVDGRKAVYW